jgi:hypothetical protein
MGYFEDALRDLAQGRIEPSQAQRVLKDRATFSFRTNPAFVNWRDPLPADIEIPLAVADVERALNRYLAGEWSSDVLRDWAEFITLVGAYSGPEPPPDDEDFYDDLWNVVHDLGAPEVFGEITRANIAGKLSLLKRYSGNLDARAT